MEFNSLDGGDGDGYIGVLFMEISKIFATQDAFFIVVLLSIPCSWSRWIIPFDALYFSDYFCVLGCSDSRYWM